MTRKDMKQILKNNNGIDECMLSNRAKEWVELMNNPTKSNPYGTTYSFKELITKYTDLKEEDDS